MKLTLSHKTKQFVVLLLKLGVVFLAFYFIYEKLMGAGALDFKVFWDFVSTHKVFTFQNVLVVVMLTVLNWIFEVLKWQNLVSHIKTIKFFKAMEQSLGAHTASLFTPNRLGEYGAKAVYFPKPERKRVLLLNLLGHMVQMMVTLVLGVTGLMLFVVRFELRINVKLVFVFGMLMVVVLLGSMFLFRTKSFSIKGFSLAKIREYISGIHKNILTKTILYALLRYLIFSTQFFLILNGLGAQIHYGDAIIAITSMYLLASVVPSVALFDVVVRGGAAVFLFSFLEVNQLMVLSTTTLMWLLNFVLPSVFGSYFVMIFNWDKHS